MGGEPPNPFSDWRAQIMPTYATEFKGPLDELPTIVRHALTIYENVSGVSPTDAMYLLKEAEERPENLRALEAENEQLRTTHAEDVQAVVELQAEVGKAKDQLALTRRQLEDSREQFRKADGQRDLLLTAVVETRELAPLRGSSRFLAILERLRQKDEALYDQIMDAD